VTLAALFKLAQREGDYTEWVGQLWLERGAILERVAGGADPHRVLRDLARRVREEGTLESQSGRTVREFPIDPRRFR